MQTITNLAVLLPVLLLIIQSSIILLLAVVLLRKLKVLKVPYAGMEYSHVILAGSIIFGAFFISISDVANLFQAYKAYDNLGESVARNLFIKFGQFLLVILFFEILFSVIVFTVTKIALGMKSSIKEIEDGNLPLSILLSVIIVCFALVLSTASTELMDLITPRFLSIR